MLLLHSGEATEWRRRPISHLTQPALLDQAGIFFPHLFGMGCGKAVQVGSLKQWWKLRTLCNVSVPLQATAGTAEARSVSKELAAAKQSAQEARRRLAAAEEDAKKVCVRLCQVESVDLLHLLIPP